MHLGLFKNISAFQEKKLIFVSIRFLYEEDVKINLYGEYTLSE